MKWTTSASPLVDPHPPIPHPTSRRMTAPVLTKISPGAGPFCKSNFTVSFFLPFTRQGNPPTPFEKRVYVAAQPDAAPARRVFVVRGGGSLLLRAGGRERHVRPTVMHAHLEMHRSLNDGRWPTPLWEFLWMGCCFRQAKADGLKPAALLEGVGIYGWECRAPFLTCAPFIATGVPSFPRLTDAHASPPLPPSPRAPMRSRLSAVGPPTL